MAGMEFTRDFNSWNKEKKGLEKDGHKELVFHEREIWWCSLGANLGDEQDGKNELFERPVLVVKKFNKRVAWILPLTTKPKEGIYYHQLEHESQVFNIILSQLRLISVKRFRRSIRKISPHQFDLVQKKLSDLIIK